MRWLLFDVIVVVVVVVGDGGDMVFTSATLLVIHDVSVVAADAGALC